MTIPLTKPSIKRKDMDAVLTTMVSENVGPGGVSSQFVSAFASYLGVAGGVALREYPRAIDTVFRALELGEGSRVGLSPLLPAAYYFVCRDRGVEPVFLDVQQDVPLVDLTALSDGTVDPSGLDALILDTALGFVPDYATAEGLGVPIIEDISHGLGAVSGERRAGTVGRFVLAGLESDHIVTAGGGAAALAGNNKRRSVLRKAAAALPQECILPDMNAALAETQIREIDGFLERRGELGEHLEKAVGRSRHRLPVQPDEAGRVPYSVPVLVESAIGEVVAYAKKHGVESRAAFEESIIGSYQELETEGLPNARAFALRCVQFPLYPMLSRSELQQLQRVLTTLP
jgi:dTDP-4-amino-4,6-dideoxygalactose transaminase